MTCPRCHREDAYIEAIAPEDFFPGTYVHPGARHASVECDCWPEPFQVRSLSGEVRLSVPQLSDEGFEAMLAAESHPDESVVGWGVAT